VSSPSCTCGSEWWVQQELIRPAAAPSQNQHVRTTPAEVRYRLVCASCGTPAGAATPAAPAPSASPAPAGKAGRKSTTRPKTRS
jgi:hypothetical protein